MYGGDLFDYILRRRGADVSSGEGEEGIAGACEGSVMARDERQIAGQFNALDVYGPQNALVQLRQHIDAGQEAYAHLGQNQAFEKFVRVELHCDAWDEFMLSK